MTDKSPSGMLMHVTFRFPGTLAPAAQWVAVVGPFNGWDPNAHRLTKTSDNDWTITIYLPPGRAIYCFDVDGAYWLDPDDDERLPNSWGSEYSVRNVGKCGETRQLMLPDIPGNGHGPRCRSNPG